MVSLFCLSSSAYSKTVPKSPVARAATTISAPQREPKQTSTRPANPTPAGRSAAPKTKTRPTAQPRAPRVRPHPTSVMHVASSPHDPRFQNSRSLFPIFVLRDIRTIGSRVPQLPPVLYSLAVAHMLVYKCDACKKPIPESNRDSALAVEFGSARYHLCKQCAAPIVRILERYKLITSKA
jgi:hypothetical protein